MAVTLSMLLSLPVLLLFSAFFSGSETALFSLTRHQRAQLARSTAVTGVTITTLLAETRMLLITLLLGNMTVNVLYFAIASMAAIRLATPPEGSGLEPQPTGAAAVTLGSLLAVILLGEVLPKLIASRLTLGWARVASLPLMIFHRVIAPIRVVSSRLIITPLARLIAPSAAPAALSASELEHLLELSQNHGVIDAGEERLLQQVLELSQLKVRDLMVPRVDMRAHRLDADPAELVDLIRQTRLRTIPVYDGDLDNVVGTIASRDAVLAPPATPAEVRKLVRPPRFVPELQRADRLLTELRRLGVTVCIVVDEYGGTSGLVTIEDGVEHVVGDIAGSFETDGQPRVEPLGGGRYRVDAGLSVHEWAGVFGRDPQVEGVAALQAVSTVAGLVMAMLGRVPRVGDAVRVGNVSITVDRMRDASRIETVVIAVKPMDGGTP